MLKSFVLLLPYVFVLRSFAERVNHVHWIEHLGLCRDPSSYEMKNLVKTSQACKDLCAKDHRCVMVKYNNLKKKCWLSGTKSLIPQTKCSIVYDFYIKVLPAPTFSWKKELHTCKMETPYKIWFIETAQECMGTCAEETKCKLVKYSPEERKCYFSSSTELKSYHKCMVKYDFYTKASTMEHHEMLGNVSPLNVEFNDHAFEIVSDKAREETETLIFSIRRPKLPDIDVEDKESPEDSTESIEIDTGYPEIETEPPRKTTEYPTMYTEYLEETTPPKKATDYPEERKTHTPFTDHQITTILAPTILPPVKTSITDRRKPLPEVELREFWLSHPQLCLSVSHYEELHDIYLERHCRWECEQQTNCLMVQYDPNLQKCWLSDARKMVPKEGCSKLFDYYIKGRDECEGKRGKCHRNAACKTIRFHRICQCVYGFEGDGWNCKDINECSYYQNLCGENARCINTIGSYSCKCKQGFDNKDGECKNRGSATKESQAIDIIAQWKQEHSAAISIYITTIWTIVFSFCFNQAFFFI